MSESEMQAELERFPVTLYKEQWLRILAGSPSSKPYSFVFSLESFSRMNASISDALARMRSHCSL